MLMMWGYSYRLSAAETTASTLEGLRGRAEQGRRKQETGVMLILGDQLGGW